MAGLVIFGAGGHARSVLELAAACRIKNVRQVKFPDNVSEISDEFSADDSFIIAVADRASRITLSNQLKDLGLSPATLISDDAVVSTSAEVGAGCVIMAGAIIRAGVIIGQHSIINTGAIVDHDSSIGGFCHVAPGAVICGGVSVEDEVWVGASATLLQDISVAKGSVIGAAALVNRSITTFGTFVGVPARRSQ